MFKKFFAWIKSLLGFKKKPVKKLSFLVPAQKPKPILLSGYHRFQQVNSPGSRPVSFGNFRAFRKIKAVATNKQSFTK